MWLVAAIGRNAMFLAGLSLLVFVLLRRTYRYYGRRRPAGAASGKDPRPTPRRTRDQRAFAGAPPEVLQWQVDMHDTARELKAELDSKMRLLQHLIAQARYESQRLEQLLDGQASAEDAVHDDSATLALLGPLDAPCPSPPDDAPPARLPGTPACQAEVFLLADQGRTAREIAERVELCVGEVELILSLRGTTPGSSTC